MNSRMSMKSVSRKSPPPTLRHKSEFRRVFRTGRRLRGEFLQIVYAKSRKPESAGSSGGRVGYVIPEKAIRGAVRRNRARRLLREAVRNWWMHIVPGYDIVIVVGKAPKFDHAGYVEMVLLDLLLKADLLISDGVPIAEERIASLAEAFQDKEASA
jgi:ribonuclease P protein component